MKSNKKHRKDKIAETKHTAGSAVRFGEVCLNHSNIETPVRLSKDALRCIKVRAHWSSSWIRHGHGRTFLAKLPE